MIADNTLEYWVKEIETSLKDMGKLDDFSKIEIRSMAEDIIKYGRVWVE